jgi:hypothetical protein
MAVLILLIGFGEIQVLTWETQKYGSVKPINNVPNPPSLIIV